MKWITTFRPLSGSRYFKYVRNTYWNKKQNLSVPFRGLVISNIPQNVEAVRHSTFRPLSGSRYFKFSPVM